LVSVRLENLPEGLYQLIKNLAAADGISVDEEIVRLLLAAMYGPGVLSEPPPTVAVPKAVSRRPLDRPDPVGSSPGDPTARANGDCSQAPAC
jgi:hypothetical protein